METVGFVGLGKMGTPMAVNIQKAGYPMVVYDVREEASKPLLEGGARLAGSPAEVARLSDIVAASLPSPQGIRPGAIFMDMSACGPDVVRGLEPLFKEEGAHVMDTPVLSSPLTAADRGVIVMVGGDRAVFDRLRPMLDVFADKVVYAGSLGSGAVCKLVHNMITGVVIQCSPC